VCSQAHWACDVQSVDRAIERDTHRTGRHAERVGVLQRFAERRRRDGAVFRAGLDFASDFPRHADRAVKAHEFDAVDSDVAVLPARGEVVLEPHAERAPALGQA
jgi:hypothetical protein